MSLRFVPHDWEGCRGSFDHVGNRGVRRWFGSTGRTDADPVHERSYRVRAQAGVGVSETAHAAVGAASMRDLFQTRSRGHPARFLGGQGGDHRQGPMLKPPAIRDDAQEAVYAALTDPRRGPARFRLADHVREDPRFSYPLGAGGLELRHCSKRMPPIYDRDACRPIIGSPRSRPADSHRSHGARCRVPALVAAGVRHRGVEVLESEGLRAEFADPARRLGTIYG